MENKLKVTEVTHKESTSPEKPMDDESKDFNLSNSKLDGSINHKSSIFESKLKNTAKLIENYKNMQIVDKNPLSKNLLAFKELLKSPNKVMKSHNARVQKIPLEGSDTPCMKEDISVFDTLLNQLKKKEQQEAEAEKPKDAESESKMAKIEKSQLEISSSLDFKDLSKSIEAPNVNLSQLHPSRSKNEVGHSLTKAGQRQSQSPSKNRKSENHTSHKPDAFSTQEPEVNIWKQKIEEQKKKKEIQDKDKKEDLEAEVHKPQEEKNNKVEAKEEDKLENIATPVEESENQEKKDAEEEISKMVNQHNDFLGEESNDDYLALGDSQDQSEKKVESPEPPVVQANNDVDSDSDFSDDGTKAMVAEYDTIAKPEPKEDNPPEDKDLSNTEDYLGLDETITEKKLDDTNQTEDYLGLGGSEPETITQKDPPESNKEKDQSDYLDLGVDSGNGDDLGLESYGSKDGLSDLGNSDKKDNSFNLESGPASKKDSFNLGSHEDDDSLGLGDNSADGNDSFLGGGDGSKNSSVKGDVEDPFGYDDTAEAVGNDDLDFQNDSFEQERKEKERKKAELEAKKKQEEEERQIELELKREAEELERQKREIELQKKKEEEEREKKRIEIEKKAAEELKKKMQLDAEDLYFKVMHFD